MEVRIVYGDGAFPDVVCTGTDVRAALSEADVPRDLLDGDILVVDRRPSLWTGRGFKPSYPSRSALETPCIVAQMGKCAVGCRTVHVNIPYAGPPNPKLLLLGQAPGRDEDIENTHFVGVTGTYTRQLLQRIGIPLEEVGFCNLIRCFPHSDGFMRDPTLSEVEACRYWLEQDLPRLNPGVIVTCGNLAFELLTGKKKKTRGTRMMVEIGGREYRLIPTHHPAVVATRGMYGLESAIISDLSQAYNVAKGVSPFAGCDYSSIDNPDKLSKFVDYLIELYRDGVIEDLGVDLETTGLDMFDPDGLVLLVSISHRAKQAVCVFIDHFESPWVDDPIVRDFVVAELRRLFSIVPIFGHNIKFDVKWLKMKLGIDVKISFETMLASQFLYTAMHEHDLKSLLARYEGMGGYAESLYDALRKLGWKSEGTTAEEGASWALIPKDILIPYACADADGSGRLKRRFKEQLLDRGMYEAFMLLVTDSIIPIAELEMAGMYVDVPLLDQALTEQRAQLEGLLASMRQQHDVVRRCETEHQATQPLWELNFTNNNRIAELIYRPQYMGSPMATVTEKKGLGSVAESVMKDLATFWNNTGRKDYSAIINTIMEGKSLSTLISRYTSKLPGYVKDDGCVHTTYNLGLRTGRLSTTEPAIHQIPAHRGNTRAAFISRWRGSGGLILSTDYSQIELRVAGMISADPVMLELLAKGSDLHREMAAALLSEIQQRPVDPSEVSDEFRSHTKALNFGILYGESPDAIAAKEGMSAVQAKEFVDGFFRRFKQLKVYIDVQHEMVRKHGFVFIPSGRIRNIPEAMTSTDPGIIAQAERRAINSPIQGMASDITLTSHNRMFKRLRAERFTSRLIGYVHDELVWDVYPGELTRCLTVAHEEMEEAPQRLFNWVTAATPADFEIGPSWKELIKVKFGDRPGLVHVSGSRAHYERTKALLTLAPKAPAVVTETVTAKEEKGKVIESVSATLDFGV